MILFVVVSNNFYVKDTNGHVKVLTAPEQQERDARIVKDMSQRHKEQVIYFYNNPEEHKKFVERSRKGSK